MPNINPQIFSISKLHLIRHILALVFTIVLGISLLMTELTKYIQMHHVWHINNMTLPYLLLLFFALIIAASAVLSVRKIKIDSYGIEINNLLWQEKIEWQNIKWFKAPKYLRFAWLRTKFFLYLIVKREFKNYSELEELLANNIIGPIR